MRASREGRKGSRRLLEDFIAAVAGEVVNRQKLRTRRTSRRADGERRFGCKAELRLFSSVEWQSLYLLGRGHEQLRKLENNRLVEMSESGLEFYKQATDNPEFADDFLGWLFDRYYRAKGAGGG